MKFLFDRDSMIKEISIAQEIITNKSPISILSNILLEAKSNTLTIKASDTSVNFISHIPIDIQEEGSTTIFCDKFMGILNSLPSGEIEFEQEDIKIIIKPILKKIKFQLKSIASDKFPEIASTQNNPFFEISSKDFKEMIKQTVFSVSSDTNRFFMTGVFFSKKDDNLIMVSTDGRRLSFVSKNIAQSIPDFTSSIIPTKILNCILKNSSSEGTILVSIVDKMIFIKFGNYEFSSLLLDGKFPNYERVIPSKQLYSFQVEKKELENALKRISLMIDKKICRILFKISPGVLRLYSPESEIGTAYEEIPCRYSDKETIIALNYHYIEEPLKAIDEDNIIIEFSESMKAITLKTEKCKDYFHVIMPMNLE